MKIINLAQTLLRKHSWFVAAFQALLIFVSLVLAWFLTHNLTLPDRRLLLFAAGLLIASRMVAIAYFGLLHGWWRYTGLSDTLDVIRAVVAGSVPFVVITLAVARSTGFPRTVYVLEPLLTAGTLIGVRVFSRVLAESVRQDLSAARKVLLIGAGVGAQTVVREIGQSGSEYAPVGYVDDDRSKLGLKIEGIPVLSTVDQLPELAAEFPIDEVLIAVPSASSRQMQRFVEICERAKVKFRTVPALRDVIAQRVSISDFRDVDVDDLLGRDPVEIDLQAVGGAIQGRSILVTGAAGSIGSELCRQILDHGPSLLVCVDQNENGMFYLEQELLRRAGAAVVQCHIADAGDQKRMEQVFQQARPETVFHAAAYKHVPLMEANVEMAVQNNVFGLMNLLEVACESGCTRFVMISSDKAVNPSNVMGATKRLGERIIACRPTNGMRCLSVRFGNVLGSNGSVIPTLQQQLSRNEPLTVTHPHVKRFFMTIREAVSLVLQASVIGEKGDTLVLDMGKPLPVLELVRTLIRLSGKDDDQVEIRFTGLRPGEKLAEELFYADEEVDETSFSKIKRARGQLLNWETLAQKLDELEAALFMNNADGIRAKIKEILPEYSSAVETTWNVPVEPELWLMEDRTKIA
ncbi:MAG TPA: nucleoside-diphosphate sugar epimerase/dehydratase [Candidatus Solibacter sp.]|nr:nucleoside-diphosphate sugar epimerase/dehydratase [Candidatus Solibacter sp.]